MGSIKIIPCRLEDKPCSPRDQDAFCSMHVCKPHAVGLEGAPQPRAEQYSYEAK